jgi:thioredoxin 1
MSNATVSISTIDEFQSLIDGNDTVLFDFWAAWCGPCRMFAPVFEQAAADHPDVVFAKVDTEVAQELAGALRIMSIPTLMAFRGGVLVFDQPGALPAHVFSDLVGKVVALDIEEIRAAAQAESEGVDGRPLA